MPRFLTKFIMTPFEGCVMNPYDAVDRLSYVDSTTQIVRMLSAGVNLRMRNSQGMQEVDFNAPSAVVYAPDVAEAQTMLNELEETLKYNASVRNAEFEASKQAEKETETADNAEPVVTPSGDD